MLETSDFLEQALVEEGVITAEQLLHCRELITETGCRIDEAIETLGFADGKRIATTKAQLCEVPFADLTAFEVNLENCHRIPRNVADKYRVFPLFECQGVITVGMDDPLNLEAMDQVRRILKCEVDPVQCETKGLVELIDRAYSLAHREEEDDDDGEIKNEDEEAGPIVSAVNTLLADAVSSGASDIHINPDQNELHIRFRIDGALQKRQGPPLSMHAKIVQRLKVMSGLDLTQTRRPQDGKFRFERHGNSVDVRVSVIPTITGENVVLRLLNNRVAFTEFTNLGMPTDIVDRLQAILAQPYGMLLATGPTGSGKTTTLYTAIARLNTHDRNIITIEDPVEIRLPLVRQIQINHSIGLDFANVLRSVLRQDPDVILVGEIRDPETASIALQSSLTGHFVLSTLHTNDAAGTVTRLRDYGLPSFIINSALLGVIAQRLVRQVCPHCAEPATYEPWLLQQFRITDPTPLRSGDGCSHCNRTGYIGRLGVYELLTFTDKVRAAVSSEGDGDAIRAAAQSDGMRLMWEDGVEKVMQGMTSLEEVAKLVSTYQINSGSELRRSA